jgi:hypothetical protein
MRMRTQPQTHSHTHTHTHSSPPHTHNADMHAGSRARAFKHMHRRRKEGREVDMVNKMKSHIAAEYPENHEAARSIRGQLPFAKKHQTEP